MPRLKAVIGSAITRIITSPRLQEWRRAWAAKRRSISGKPATVHYFHQADDPYSQLVLPLLSALQQRYRIEMQLRPVPGPEASAAPDLARLAEWSRRDAARLATHLSAAGAESPDFAAMEAIANPTPLAMQRGAALRKKLGHYLGATLFFEGEWYWGVDRLHYLEKRLVENGLARDKTPFTSPFLPLVAPPQLLLRPLHAIAGISKPVIHFYCSLRSPYTYLAASRVRALAEHYGADLQLRFVLPMVMRGLPVPLEKRLYILRDTKREALRMGIEFGNVVDPVGQPVEDGLALLHLAITQGKGSAFLESFLQGVFAQGMDAGSAFGLEGIGLRAGLSSADMANALRDQSWRAIAEDNRADMLARGIWGVPSFRVNEMPVLWGQDRLWMLEEDLIAALNR